MPSNTFIEKNILEYNGHWIAVHCIVIFSVRSSGIVTKESKIGRISSPGVTNRDDKERYWKRIMIVDDDTDIITTFKFGIENVTKTSSKRIAVDAYNDPRIALLDFQPNFYDLLLIDLNVTESHYLI